MMLQDVLEKLLGRSLYLRFGIYAGKLGGTQSPFPRQAALNLAMHYVQMSRLTGDYLEFGVWQGKTFAAACYLARKRKLPMNFYAFDSFAGLPVNQEKDASGHQMYKGGTFNCSESEFLKNVRRTGADTKRIITVPGWFEESLQPDNPKLAELRKAAVVWVDCDLYGSTVSVLNFLTPYLQYGTLVFFDDWLAYRADPNAGEQRAFREWLDANPHLSAVEFLRVGWHGFSFVMHDHASRSYLPQRDAESIPLDAPLR
jgi:O-methyltransferase